MGAVPCLLAFQSLLPCSGPYAPSLLALSLPGSVSASPPASPRPHGELLPSTSDSSREARRSGRRSTAPRLAGSAQRLPGSSLRRPLSRAGFPAGPPSFRELREVLAAQGGARCGRGERFRLPRALRVPRPCGPAGGGPGVTAGPRGPSSHSPHDPRLQSCVRAPRGRPPPGGPRDRTAAGQVPKSCFSLLIFGSPLEELTIPGEAGFRFGRSSSGSVPAELMMSGPLCPCGEAPGTTPSAPLGCFPETSPRISTTSPAVTSPPTPPAKGTRPGREHRS